MLLRLSLIHIFSARELKGHNILAVERFWDDTRWMIEFSVLRPSTAYGSPGEEIRLFLTEDRYQAALQSQQRREIKIKRYARVIEGHILEDVYKRQHLPQRSAGSHGTARRGTSVICLWRQAGADRHNQRSCLLYTSVTDKVFSV